MEIPYNDIDRRIWEEELADFVPDRIFDAHSHIFMAAHCLQTPDDPVFPRPDWLDRDMPNSDLESLKAWQATLLPQREIHFLLIPFPFYRVDLQAQVKFMATEAAKDPLSAAEMVVSPKMEPEWVAEQIERHGFVGLKPYRFFADDPVECRITDMIPEALLEVADDKGLLITLHMAKSKALADPENIADIKMLSSKYPQIRWILAHCARCFAPWAIEHSIHQIKDLHNIWFDTAAVCATEVFNFLIDAVPEDRILFGTDSLSAGNLRGKYIWFGYAWNDIGQGSIPMPHCEAAYTYVQYESLRALRYAVQRHGWSKRQIEALFFDNAVRLIHGEDKLKQMQR